MNRSNLEHDIRACGAISLDDEFIIIGSQAIPGAHPDAPETLLRSMDLDLYPKNRPADSVAIDGAIGEGSLFHQTFGYYPHGVGPETAVLPTGWHNRLVAARNANTHGAIGWCLEPHDLAISKLVAGREQDVDFVKLMLAHHIVSPTTLTSRLDQTPLDASTQTHVLGRLTRLTREKEK